MLAPKVDHGSLFRRVREPVARHVNPLDERRLADARHTWVARRVPLSCMGALLEDGAEPAPGDLVMARVERVGRFDFIESAACTMAAIAPGDEVIVCYAPVDERPPGAAELHLVNPAGIASAAAAPNYLSARATVLRRCGRLADGNGKPLNIADWAIPAGFGLYIGQPVIAVIGERAMPGEPCRTADVIRGLVGAGFTVGAANITGVPGCWKVRLLKNAGATLAVDITDAGYVGTSGQDPEVLEKIFLALSGYLSTSGTDVMVLEIEQDVFGRDAAAIVSTPSFQNRISTIILQGRGGYAGQMERESLRALGYDVTLVDDADRRASYHRLM